MYAELFGMGSDVTGIKALEITPDDERALAAMYRRAKASRWLRWMLTPGGPEMMDWLLIARFAAVKGQAVAAEAQAKRLGKSGQNVKEPHLPKTPAPPPAAGFPDAEQRAALTGR